MLDHVRITEIAETVAHTRLAGGNLQRVLAETATDSEGNDALRITLVLKSEAARALTGDDALEVLVGIQRGLSAAGEERFPIVEYATEQEMLADTAWGDLRFGEDD